MSSIFANLSFWIPALALGALILGVLVFIHELGHFLAAKACGIRVLTFSIGFGNALIKKRIGDTDYKIGMIPFGGYVHMAGEHPEDAQHQAAADEFQNKPVWQRAIVAIAGPAANFLTAMLALWIMFMYGVSRDTYLDRPIIGAVMDSTAASAAGLAAGDSIISINGKPIASWEAIQQMFSSQERSYDIAYFRDGMTGSATMQMPAIKRSALPENPLGGILPPVPPRIGRVEPGSAAHAAGLVENDLVTTLDSLHISSWYQFSTLIARYDSSAGPLNISVLRSGSILALQASPRFDAEQKRYLLGLQMAQPPQTTVRYSPLSAIRPMLSKSREFILMIFDVLGKLVSRKVSPSQLAGPIGIVQMSGAIAFAGLASILNFFALIGINLAVINLFPLIITDGGLLLFLLLEAIRRKPLALKYQLLLNRVAIVLFIGLFLYVTFHDIERFPAMLRMFGR